MSKTKNETPAIEVGSPIMIGGTTRAEVADKLKALKEQVAAEKLKAEGGFIEYDGGEKFSAVITFVKP
jgi:hypothetical protein